MSKSLLERIAEEQDKRTGRLDLRGLELTAFPPSVLRLDHLRTLDLDNNRIVEIPQELASFSSLTELLLDNNRVSRLPDELGAMRSLKTLYLDNNGLTEIPEGITAMFGLRVLTVNKNQIREIPSSITQMAALQVLYMRSNRLRSLPRQLSALPLLETVYCSDNQISAIGDGFQESKTIRDLELDGNAIQEVTRAIKHLEKLEYLNISRNRITELDLETGDFPGLVRLVARNARMREFRVLGRIPNIRKLELQNNQLQTLSIAKNSMPELVEMYLASNRLSSISSSLGSLAKLEAMYLANNELTTIPRGLMEARDLSRLDVSRNRLSTLPISLGDHKNLAQISIENNPLPDAIILTASRGSEYLKSYLQSLAVDAQPLYEAKIVLVGEGNVGKTSLLAALRGAEFVEQRLTTHGIEIHQLKMQAPGGTKIVLNCWDFGGQPVYRVSHQFFFSRRSIYLVVWNPREGADANDVDAWIRRIRLRVGDDARVLVVSTHSETGERVARIDKERVSKKYGPIVVGFHSVDSKTGFGIAELRTAISETAWRLPQMGELINSSWKRTRDEVLSQQGTHISWSEFESIGTAHGLDDFAKQTLAGLMHDLGDIIHFDDDGLRDVVVLQPEWLTKAIGYVLEDKDTNLTGGLLPHSALHRIWWAHGVPGREIFPRKLHPFFLRLMEKFDVSYRIEGQEASLVTQLVPTERPRLSWLPSGYNEEFELNVVCELDEAPPGLIPWLIVRTHRYGDKMFHWQEGLLLDNKKYGVALLELESTDVRLLVRGSYPTHFMSILLDSLVHLVSHRWPGLDYVLSVPCHGVERASNCDGRLNLDVLRKVSSTGRASAMCPGCGEEVSCERLLLGFEAREATLDGLSALKRTLERMTRATHEDVARIAAVTRQILRAVSTETGECPRLFTLSPVEKTQPNFKDLGVTRYTLTLWCEAPGDEHACGTTEGAEQGVYTVARPRDWLLRIWPYASLIGKLLKVAVPLAVPISEMTLRKDITAGIGADLKLMEKVVSSMLPGELTQAVATMSSELTGASAWGASLRELSRLLIEVDPKRKWGGLRRVLTETGDYLWLCVEHYKTYDPGMPTLQSRLKR